jgi:site-specific recombinase XerD
MRFLLPLTLGVRTVTGISASCALCTTPAHGLQNYAGSAFRISTSTKSTRLFMAKGRKVRTVPLWDSTTAFLRTYLKSERRVPLAPYRDFLFINQRRAHLTRSGLYYLCSRYLAAAAGKAPTIEHKKIHPVHGWRYTTASHLALAGVDVTVIQEWLGHVSINTTCRYKGIPIETKREALRKFYLFQQSWQEAMPAGVDWNLYPDLLAFLESL